MRSLFLILAVLALAFPAGAAEVYETGFPGEADAKVYVTHFAGEATCIVYRTEFEGEAKTPGIWYFSKFRSLAVPIYFTTSRSEADLIVYFTDFRGQAHCRI